MGGSKLNSVLTCSVSREKIVSKVKEVQCIFSMPNEVHKYGAECIIKKIYGDFYSEK